MDTNLIIVYRFDTGMQAELARTALESAGIDALIQADSAGGMRPHLAWASGGYKLLVREGDVDAARQILETPASQISG